MYRKGEISSRECCEAVTCKNDGCLEALLELSMTHQLPLHNDIKKGDLKIGEVIGKGVLLCELNSPPQEKQDRYIKGLTKANRLPSNVSITVTKLMIRNSKKNFRS